MIVCLLSFSWALAQEQEPYAHYTIKDGLPSNRVYAIEQDSLGNIWIGTENGLCKFDGYDFECFGNEIGLLNLDILALKFDDLGRLWISTRSHAPSYYEDGKVHYLDLPNQKNDLNIFSYGVEVTDTIVVFAYRTLYFLDSETLEILSVLEIEKGKEDVLKRWYARSSNGNMRKYGGKYVSQSKFSFDINTYDIVTQKTEVIHLKGFETLEKRKWINSQPKIENDSLFICPTKDGLFLTSLVGSPLPYNHILKGRNIFGLFRDRNASLWVGTKNSGLFVLGNNIFTTEKSPVPRRVRIFPSAIEVLELKEDEFFVQSELGKNWILDRYLNPIDSFSMFFGTEITDLEKIDTGYIVQTPRITYVCNSNAKKITHVFKTHFRSLVKKMMLFDDRITMFSNKIQTIDGSQKVDTLQFYPPARTTVVTKISDNLLWFGTSRGLYQFSSSDHAKINRIDSLLFNTAILDIEKISENVVAVANTKIGIVLYDISKPTPHIMVTWNESKDIVHQLVLQDSILLGVTNQGLYKFQLPDLKRLGYMPMDLTDELKSFHVLDDQYIVAMNNALYSFSGEIPTSSQRSILTLDKILVNDSLKTKADLADLAWDQNNLSIKFNVPYFAKNELAIRYRVVGLHEHPIEITNRELYLLQLPPGDYELEAVATVGGEAISNHVVLPFCIAKPWWQTWYFILLCVFALLSVLYYLLRDRDKKQLAKSELLQMRLNAVHAQMNPHFLFNSLQSLQFYIMRENKVKATKYLSTFARFVRQTLDTSAKEFISLTEEVDYLSNYLELEKEKLEDNLEYEIIDSIEDKQVLIPSMIIQPFVENAVVHGFKNSQRENKITITMEPQGADALLCTVSDNGQGVQKKKSNNGHTSFATKAIERKLELIHQLQKGRKKYNGLNIEIMSNKEVEEAMFREGTTVKIRIPVR